MYTFNFGQHYADYVDQLWLELEWSANNKDGNFFEEKHVIS